MYKEENILKYHPVFTFFCLNAYSLKIIFILKFLRFIKYV